MTKAVKDVISKTKKDKYDFSVDDTWEHTRHTSLNGCVAAILIDSGKVLHLEVMSLESIIIIKKKENLRPFFLIIYFYFQIFMKLDISSSLKIYYKPKDIFEFLFEVPSNKGLLGIKIF